MGKRKEITGKDNGKQKMWIMITVIIVFFAMAGYAGMSYYYSDRFFRGTTINGINCSGKTSEEAEQAVAKKAEDYLLEVKARNLKSQSINGKLIGYRYVSDGIGKEYYLQVAFENGAVEELHVSLSTYNKTKAGAPKILTLQKGFFGLPVITKGL